MKRFLSTAMILSLVVALALSASSCSGSSSTTGGGTTAADFPEGIGDVSQELKDKLSNSGKVVTYLWGNPESEVNDSVKNFQQHFTDVYGGEIDYRIIQWEGWERTFLTQYAANDAPDIIEVSDKLWPKVANRGMVYSTQQLTDLGVVGLEHPLLQENLEPIAKNFTYNHQVYSFAFQQLSAGYCLVNDDLFEEYEVKSPKEYYEEGLWNWDNFVKCISEITQDTDGDGKNDIYGYYGWDLDYFVRANDGQLITIGEDGTLTLNTQDQRVLNALQNIKDLYGVKKVATGTDSFAKGTTAMQCWLADNCLKTIVNNNGLTFNWSLVPYPCGPDNTTNASPGVMTGYGVVSSSQNPQGAVNYVIAIKAYAEATYVKPTEPTLGKLESVFDEDTLAMIEENNKFATSCLYLGVGDMKGKQWDFWGAVKNANRSVSEVLNTYEPLFQAQIDLEMASAAQ
jgi:ABC-type glycerol-3-phosphate transport system substrate-binding protein